MLLLHHAHKEAIRLLFVLVLTIIVSNTGAEDLPTSNEAMNHAPSAVNDTASTTLNTSIPIAVLDNDSDPDNDLLEIISYTHPTHGFVEQQGNRLVYTPDANFIGTDAFGYTISDGYLTETTATATSTAIAVLSPEGDFTDTDTFTFTLTDNDGGEAIADADGTATILRNAEDMPNNSESFTFTISDAVDGEAIATATAIAIASTEDATATATATAIAIHTPIEDFTESESFIFTITGTNNSETSAITETVAEIIYIPSENHFSYTVHNENGEEVTATTIAIAIATASATVIALAVDSATVSINVKPAKPTVTLAKTSYTTTADTGTVHVADWITQATDGIGGIQRPHGGDNLEPIYFYVTSNSNPALFSEQPWLSHPSHSLHFTTQADTQGSAEICMKAVTKKGHGVASEIQCFTITISASLTETVAATPTDNSDPSNTTNTQPENTVVTAAPTTETVTPTDNSDPSNTTNTQPENTVITATPNNALSTAPSPATPSAAPIAVANTDTTPTNDDNKTITETEGNKGAGGSFNITLLMLLASLGFFRRKNRDTLTQFCLSAVDNKISTNYSK